MNFKLLGMLVRLLYLAGTLQQHCAVLDLGRGLCHLHNQDLPLLKTTEMTPDSCSAHVTECTTIPPHCEMHCAVKLMPVAAHLCTPTGYNGLLEPYHTDLDGVTVARTLARADNGFTVVRVLNPTNTPIVLQPGMQLGQFTPVTDNEISTAAPTVCQVSAPPPTSPQSLPFDVKCGSFTDSQFSELFSNFVTVIH